MVQDDEKKGLEHSLLHRTMVFFCRPAGWSLRLIALAGVLLSAIVALVWRGGRKLRSVALPAGIIHLLFLVADVFLLRQLPRRNISYGPWKAQAAVLATPRTAAALCLPLVSRFLGGTGTLALHAGLQGLGTALLYWGAAVEPRRLGVTHIKLELAGLPPQAAPIRLLHISDIHMERATQTLEDLLAQSRALQPDAIMITGDYLNLSYNQDETAIRLVSQLLRQLPPTDNGDGAPAAFATLGSPPVDLRESVLPIFDDVPVRLLRDEWAVLDLGEGRRLHLLGMDCTHDRETDADRLQRLASAGPTDGPRVLLYHSPELMPEAQNHEFALYLCGHTHGGQVRLPVYGAVLTSSRLGKRYVMGHYHENGTHLYVSRGVGLEGLSAPRVRFLSPPEITLFTLSPPASTQDRDKFAPPERAR